jgi:superfamily I DNA and RNA helicase
MLKLLRPHHSPLAISIMRRTNMGWATPLLGYAENSWVRLPIGQKLFRSLHRSQTATPPFFTELISAEDAVRFFKFESGEDELEWLADAIKTNLNQDELEHDDILIVVPEALTIRATAPNVMRALRKRDIQSHLVGVTASRDAVFSGDSIAITSIYRAKGNEAPVVYVLGSEYCYGGFNILRKRNILFTAITRSRGWVCVSGVGDGMASLFEEYQAIKNNNFELEFDYPTSPQLQRIRTLHRDRSSDEMQEIEQDLEGLARLIHRVESGQISLDALPIEAQAIVRRMKNERPKPANVRRKPD